VTVGEFSGSAHRAVVISADIDKVQPDTNISIILRPRGTGSLMLGSWATTTTGSIAGGNARGDNAVDLQAIRTGATQVASGAGAAIVGGSGNTASGTRSGVYSSSSSQATFTNSVVVGGASNQATADNAIVTGGRNAIAYFPHSIGNSSGSFAAFGDAQSLQFNMFQSATGTAQYNVLIGSNVNATLAATNRVWNAQIQCTGVVSAAGTGSTVSVGDAIVQNFELGIKRLNTTTSLIGTVDMTLNKSDASMTGATFTVDADDSNAEAMRIRFTPPTGASSTTVTRAHCVVRLSEIGF
jgi:hypothetical protein